MGQVIEVLALSPRHRWETAKELWPHLGSALEGEKLDPKEIEDPKNPRKSVYEYNAGDDRKTISFGRFENIVSRARRDRKSR